MALGVAAGYYLFAVIGTVLGIPPAGFAIIWPATAFLISVLLVTPVRSWWIYPIGVIPAHFLLALYFQPQAPPLVVLTQILGNLLLAVSTVFALRFANARPPQLDNFRTVFRFILLAGIAIPAVVNLLILSVHVVTGWTSDLWLSWRQWMLASIFPTITIPPLLVLAVSAIQSSRWPTRSFLAELAALSLILFALSFLVFGWTEQPAGWPALLLTPIPFLLWAAVRLGVGGTCVALLTFAAAIIAQAIQRHGPFAEHSPIEDVFSLQIFLTVIAIPSLLRAALIEDNRRTEDRLRRSEARMSAVAALVETGLWQWNEAAKELWLTDHCRSMFGFKPGSIVTPNALLEVVHVDDRARVARALKASRSLADTSPGEFRVNHPDGETRLYSVSMHSQFGRHGEPIVVSGMFQDITRRVGAEIEAEQLSRRLLTFQDDERRSIGRELHDSTAQHLVAADLNLGALKRRFALPDEALHAVDDIASLVRTAMTELRTFTFLLQPPELEGEDLSVVLKRYVEGFGRRTGLRTALKISPLADQLPQEQRLAALRIVQEGLANVHRHAGATRVSVDLRCVSGKLHLVISDDGRGTKRVFERAKGEQVLGVGIPGMTARIRQLGGKIEISSRSGGTVVHVAVPVGDPGEESPPADQSSIDH